MMLMVEAMKSRVGNPGRKLVLVKLADNANDKGECWPSYQHVADQCEMGRSTVKAHIQALEDAGFLTVTERNGGKSSNKYQLHIAAGKPEQRTRRTRSESDPVKIQPGQDLTAPRSGFDTPPGQNLTPEPVTEPVTEPVNNAPAAADASPAIASRTDRKRVQSKTAQAKSRQSAEKSFLSNLINRGVDEILAIEWIAVRKSRRLPMSVGAIDLLEREAGKVGVELSVALENCVLRGWGGFKAEWLAGDQPRHTSTAARNQPATGSPQLPDFPFED